MTSKEAYSETIQAKSCSITDVQNAISSASRGDTVIVPAGNCTWKSTLSISKSITLQGAGIGKTVITGNIDSTNTYLIYFQSVNTPNDSDVLMRITGFTFRVVDTPNVRATRDGVTYYWRNGGIRLLATDNPPIAFNKIRIDHNRFEGFVSRTYDRFNLTLEVSGTFYGVVDNNIFDGDTTIGLGHSQPWYRWNNNTFQLGTAQNFYIEDNLFIKRPIFYYYENILQANMSASYSFRYNTINFPSLQAGWNWFYGPDLHHQGYGILAPFGGEIYANRFNVLDEKSFQLGQFRGGQGLAFYNAVVFPTKVGGSDFRFEEQYYEDEDIWPLKTPCPTGTLYPGTKRCGVDGRPQHVHKSYLFNNRKGLTSNVKTLLDTINTYCHPQITSGTCSSGALQLREDTDFWKDNSCNGNTNCEAGVGCGPSLPKYCSIGTGFWLTNQSCSTVPLNMVGQSPQYPLQGALYRCTTKNIWTLYYSPYQYPHPLRSGETESISAPKGFKLIN